MHPCMDGCINAFMHACVDALMHLSILYNKPIGNGVVTALNLKQARQRSEKSNINKANKGGEAANAVISILTNEPRKI